MIMNLIFYPSDFNLEYIKDYVEEIINHLKNKNELYKLYDYNRSTVMKQENLDMCRSYGRNLTVPLDFIKEYTTTNSSLEFNIYLFSDGYSESSEEIIIDDYITKNIIKFTYIVKENKNVMGRLDFKNFWLNNPKFVYINK